MLIVFVSALFFIPFLGGVHLFDWDEINFAEAAREMLLTDNFQNVQIGFHIFTEKPPFFFWMQSLSMYIFGVNEWAARFPNAIIGIITLLVLYSIGKHLKDKKFGILWVAVYLGSFLPHFYFKSGLIDPTFNLFIFLSVYFITLLTEKSNSDEKSGNEPKRRVLYIALAGIFSGLSVLTKGPVGLLLNITTVAVYFLINRSRKSISYKELFLFLSVVFVTSFTWYGLGFFQNGIGFISEFITRNIELASTKDAGHGGPIYYHFVVLLLGCFPASILMFGGMKRHEFSNDSLQNFQKWMLAMLIIVLVIFSLVQTKIVHYSSLAYFPITYFATYFLYYYLKEKLSWKWYFSTLMLVIAVIWGIVVALVPIIGANPELASKYIEDDFVVGNLQANVNWSNYEALYGILFVSAIAIIVYLFKTEKRKKAVILLLVSGVLTIQGIMMLYVPRIEKYTQAAPIEFYEEKANEDCYITVLEMKSYAHYFYNKMQKEDLMYSKEELLRKELNKPAYFVSKNIHKNRVLEKYPQLKVMYEKNGFVFYVKNTK